MEQKIQNSNVSNVREELYPEESYDHAFWGKWFKECEEKIKKRERDIDKLFDFNMARRRKKAIPGFIYLMECESCYKIGRAIDVEKRLATIQNSNPFTVKLVAKRYVKDVIFCERLLHHTFRTRRILNGSSREWYALWIDRELPFGDLAYLLEIFNTEPLT